MNRNEAISAAERFFDEDHFFTLLAEWVAMETGSCGDDRRAQLEGYLQVKMTPYLKAMEFDCRAVENPDDPEAPFLIARRIEDPDLPTVLIYGHGDTVPPMEDQWRDGLSPHVLTREGERWYGRGAADNKGQHAVNLSALKCVLDTRGRLGFNAIVLLESGEETGSPGLYRICEQERPALLADVLIASDGPRIEPDVPTIFGGSRAVFNFDMRIDLREGGHHSGNWGGLLANPAILLSHAIACLVDARGRILVDALRPNGIPDDIRAAIDRLTVTGKGGPAIDPEWGEPGLSAAQKVYGWNTLEVLAFTCGNPQRPVNAIPPAAWARGHIRFTADSDPDTFLPAIREHLDRHGFSMVEITPVPNNYGSATRMAPDHPWVRFTMASFARSGSRDTAFLPNLGGTIPNDAFSKAIGLPTIWVPHSYGGCSQHAPNEHVLASIMREGLRLMTGLFWDIGERSDEI